MGGNPLQYILLMLDYFTHTETDINYCDTVEHEFCRIWRSKNLSFNYRVTKNYSVIQ